MRNSLSFIFISILQHWTLLRNATFSRWSNNFIFPFSAVAMQTSEELKSISLSPRREAFDGRQRRRKINKLYHTVGEWYELLIAQRSAVPPPLQLGTMLNISRANEKEFSFDNWAMPFFRFYRELLSWVQMIYPSRWEGRSKERSMKRREDFRIVAMSMRREFISLPLAEEFNVSWELLLFQQLNNSRHEFINYSNGTRLLFKYSTASRSCTESSCSLPMKKKTKQSLFSPPKKNVVVDVCRVLIALISRRKTRKFFHISTSSNQKWKYQNQHEDKVYSRALHCREDEMIAWCRIKICSMKQRKKKKTRMNRGFFYIFWRTLFYVLSIRS